jgi:hypothetical protein
MEFGGGGEGTEELFRHSHEYVNTDRLYASSRWAGWLPEAEEGRWESVIGLNPQHTYCCCIETTIGRRPRFMYGQHLCALGVAMQSVTITAIDQCRIGNR